MSKRFFQSLLVLVLTVCLFQAQAIEQQNPYTMVQEVAKTTFDRMKRDLPKIKQDPNVLRDIMEQELLPHIDYKFAAFMVLGKHIKKVKKSELQEFVKVFREYLITTYALAMGYYEDQLVEFEPVTKGFKNKRVVTVRAKVKDEGRPDINIAFKVRKDKRSNQWRAYDMTAEGISVLDSKRSEFGEELRKNGVKTVIEKMKKAISEPIVLRKRGE